MERKRRSLWGSITTSEKVDELTDSEALLYTWLIPKCDDEGRMKGRPKTVRGRVVPLRNWSISRVEKMLIRIAEVGLIWYYEVGKNQYIEMVDWFEHQTFHGFTPVLSSHPNHEGKNTHEELKKYLGSNPTREVKRSKEKKRKNICHVSDETDTVVVFQKGQDPYDLANFFATEVHKNNPRAKLPDLDTSAGQKWCKVFDLMIRCDGIEPKEIRAVISWCQSDDFEQTVVLSPAKFRKRYAELYAKAQRAGKVAQKPEAKLDKDGNSMYPLDDDWVTRKELDVMIASGKVRRVGNKWIKGE